jgi:hypothetical protein
MTGFLSWCGDKNCDCWVAVIVDNNAKEVWRGRFLEHPSEAQKEELRRELAEEAKRLGNVTIVADITYKA